MAEITERDAKKEILKCKIKEVVENRNVKTLQDKHDIIKALKRLAKEDPKLAAEAYVELVGDIAIKLAKLYIQAGREEEIPILIENLKKTFKSKK